jgi:hypothetical protein
VDLCGFMWINVGTCQLFALYENGFAISRSLATRRFHNYAKLQDHLHGYPFARSLHGVCTDSRSSFLASPPPAFIETYGFKDSRAPIEILLHIPPCHININS